MTIKRNFPSTMSSISALELSCNTFEKRRRAKLTALEAARDTDGVKVTEGTFEEFTGDPNELGKAKISSGGSQSAWILTVRTSVSISRS